MIPLHPEIQPTLIKMQKKKLIDYEKCRNNDYDITPPQRHLPDEFEARRQILDMPTCYAMDKKFEKKVCRDFWIGQYNNNNNLVKEENNEDKINFLFKVKRKQQQQRKRTSDLLLRCGKTIRRRKSDSTLYLRRPLENFDALRTFKSSIIKQILRKNKKQRKSSSLSHLGKEFEQESHYFDSFSIAQETSTVSAVK